MMLADHVRVASDADGVVLLDLSTGRYIVLNQVGGAVVEGIRAGRDLDDIVRELACTCDAEPERVLHDAQRFLGRLAEAGLVRDVAAAGWWWVPVAYVCLALAHISLRWFGFGHVHRVLRRLPPGRRGPGTLRLRGLAASIQRASTEYPAQLHCLEKSVATILLLRLRGWPGQLVLGARRMPFAAHAWVEADGVVINDDRRVQQRYAVLERC